AAAGRGAGVAGIGVSAVPGRPVDLRSDLVEGERLQVWHDADRLALTVYTAAADVTLGRQAIAWGTSALFPVADLWARFSPFELDTEEKPGIDAVRALAYPVAGVEVDAVLAAGADTDDLSAGVRASLGLPRAEVYGAAGKLWQEALALAGITFLFDEVKLRAEGALVRDLAEGGFELPRVTLGADWIRGRVALAAEYHLNGAGSAGPEGYLAHLADPRSSRAEGYYLGRHYLGILAAGAADAEERLRVSLAGLANLTDPSLSLTPTASYEVVQSATLSLGAVLGFGETPAPAGPVPRLQSEFGSYGDLWFSRASVYF
ncbi:MAG: hypothetical protein AB1505_26185, partial [Candidatus Latescibacterota bacterium]